VVALECPSAPMATYKGKDKGHIETWHDWHRGRSKGKALLMLSLGAA